MTKYELSQSDKTIIHAGRIAFTVGVPAVSNPYRKNHHLFKLWSVGFKKAKAEDDKKRDAKGRYRVYFEPVVEKPMCQRCFVPVPNNICSQCGDEYPHTEIEEKDGKR